MEREKDFRKICYVVVNLLMKVIKYVYVGVLERT